KVVDEVAAGLLDDPGGVGDVALAADADAHHDPALADGGLVPREVGRLVGPAELEDPVHDAERAVAAAAGIERRGRLRTGERLDPGAVDPGRDERERAASTAAASSKTAMRRPTALPIDGGCGRPADASPARATSACRRELALHERLDLADQPLKRFLVIGRRLLRDDGAEAELDVWRELLGKLFGRAIPEGRVALDPGHRRPIVLESGPHDLVGLAVRVPH